MQPQLILDMPAEEYHEIEALSATGARLLYSGPLEFWWGTYGPGATEESSPAQTLGTAKHIAVLEGENAFKAAYVPEMSLEDHPGVLVSQADLKEWSRSHGGKVGGSKADLCRRIGIMCDANKWECPPLWPLLLDEHRADAEESGRVILKQRDYKDALSRIAQTKGILAPLRDRGGVPEVSLLWEESGIRCKARLDFLAPGIVLDLKNIANKHRESFGAACGKAIANDMLTIQAAWYLRAAKVAAEAGLLPFDQSGKEGFIFRWLFLQSEGCPNMAVRDYLTHSTALDTGKKGLTAAHSMARDVIGKAMGLYEQYMESHGKDRPWFPPLDKRDMDDSEYPSWFLLWDDW